MNIKTDPKQRLLMKLVEAVINTAEALDHPGSVSVTLYGMDGTSFGVRFGCVDENGIDRRMVVRIYQNVGETMIWMDLTRHLSSQYGAVDSRQGYPITQEPHSAIVAITSAVHEIFGWIVQKTVTPVSV